MSLAQVLEMLTGQGLPFPAMPATSLAFANLWPLVGLLQPLLSAFKMFECLFHLDQSFKLDTTPRVLVSLGSLAELFGVP